jgi:hypothetical protein
VRNVLVSWVDKADLRARTEGDRDGASTVIARRPKLVFEIAEYMGGLEQLL